jgi:hypothetical protein
MCAGIGHFLSAPSAVTKPSFFSGIILDAAKRAATIPDEIYTENSAPADIILIHG